MKTDVPKQGSRFYRSVLGLFLSVSLAGLAVSLWAHGETWMSVDPGRRFEYVWILQLVLLALFVPIAIELFSRRDVSRFLRSPQWMRVTLYSFLAYYGVNFYFFLYWAADHLTSVATWRMFSSGWLVLFGLAALYYEVRFSDWLKDKSGQRPRRRRRRETGLG